MRDYRFEGLHDFAFLLPGCNNTIIPEREKSVNFNGLTLSDVASITLETAGVNCAGPVNHP